ncbi:MAG: carbohydrate kinase family protein [Cyanobacteria bacterium SZAS-4]|nr:carbohydrate kinase family protein [Cyanobacteria bacterium SZAS-4]
MESANSVVITIGEIVVDWISTDIGLGFKESTEFHRALGGNATNVSVAVSRLGGSSRLIAKIGADLHSDLVRTKLIEEKVDLDFLYVDSKYPTANCYGIRDASDEAIYYNWPKPNAALMLCEDDITYDAFNGASFIHATGISLTIEPRKTAVLKALEMARSKSVLVSFDASFPTDSLDSIDDAKEAMLLADLIKINLTELLYWTGLPENSVAKHLADLRQANFALSDPNVAELKNAIDAFMKNYTPIAVLLTFGPHGSMVVTEKFAVYSAPIAVESICSIGAGDAYIGAVMFCLTERQVNKQTILNFSESEWQQVATFANAVGALATKHVSAVGSLPTKYEVEQLLNVDRANAAR